jgi:[protein-PII] uridylyltransferase
VGLAGNVRSLKADLADFDRALPHRLRTIPADRLSRERARIVDDVIGQLSAPFAEEGSLALLATGGFGRLELTPASDVDLLLVHGSDSGRIEEAVTAVLYPLWDAGLNVSHAVRTTDECEAEAAGRLESLTAMASARVIAGDRELGAEACLRALQVARRDPLGFVKALSDSRVEREARFGHVDRLLEPDLKESLGGLRDVHLSGWLTWAMPAADRTSPVPPWSLLDVRLALHVANGGASNRLLAEHQDRVSRLLGIKDEPGWEARDALMRDVAVRGRDIDRHAERLLDEMRARLEGSHSSASGRTNAAAAHPPAPGARWSPSFLESFLGGLRNGRPLDRAFHEWDDFRAALPEWDRVRGRPQRDPYHRYPVDVHLMATTVEAARLLNEPDEPFAGQAAAAVSDRDGLLLGALLHDIGKIGEGSHIPAGVRVAGQVLDRAGVGGRRREDVLFLVGEHLLLSDSATRRNVNDEDLVLRIAGRIRTAERLGMLYLLTVADAHATGPGACTPWRMNLIRDLVSKVSQVIERGHVDVGRAQRLERAEASVRDALRARPAEEVEVFLQSVPSAYLLSVSPGDVPVHFQLMSERPRPDEARIDVRPGQAEGTHVLTVVALDRLGLLADIAGALSASGLSILAARAFTSERGVALDEFEVLGAFERHVPAERWDRFQRALDGAMRGANLEQRLRSIRSHYRRPPAGIAVRIRIDQESSDFFTVVEVEGPDRIGLLFDLGRTFARLGVDVHLAKVATYGPRVVDVFYVTDEEGERIEDRELLTELIRGLASAASG